MILVYKYRLKDNSAKKRLKEHAIALNQVWNFCVQTQRECDSKYWAGAPRRRWPTHFDLQKLTAGSSKLLGTHAGSITEICRRFAESRDLHRRSPKFRASFGARRSLGWVPFRACDRTIRDKNSVFFLGKIYRWFGNKRRPLPETVKGGAFVEDSQGRWWVCFNVEISAELPKGNGEVGIDLGLKTLATLSDGGKIDNLRHREFWGKKLASAHRSNNKKRIKAIHAKIANCRRDHLHKASNKLTKENSLIVVGDVSPSRLARTKMAGSILDAGWSSFRKMLSYKASRHSAIFIEVSERFTTQACSQCGALGGPKGIAGLGIREWECSSCGASHDRDVNSAKIILALGRSAAPPGEGSQLANIVCGRISTTSGVGEKIP